MRVSKIRTMSLLAVLMGFGAPFVSAQDWNHNPESVNGPDHWDEIGFPTCGTGMVQTPIDIKDSVRSDATLHPLALNYHDTALDVDNTGHVIEVPYEPGSYLTLGADTYELKQFHFHAPSEHTNNGAAYDMEVHFVHKDVTNPNKIAVVGVWVKACQSLDHSCKPNATIESIFANAPEEEGIVNVAGVSVNGENILPIFGIASVPNNAAAPAHLSAYYTYGPGSLTTPPCTEGLTWFVAKNPVAVSQATINKFHRIIAKFKGYDGYPNNNRPIQDTNGRIVYERSGK